jgi:hypothetical protein
LRPEAPLTPENLLSVHGHDAMRYALCPSLSLSVFRIHTSDFKRFRHLSSALCHRFCIHDGIDDFNGCQGAGNVVDPHDVCTV